MTATSKRRRPPLIVFALLGATAAATYGHFVLSMGFGPPLVMVGLGGLTLALSAGALWGVIDPLTRGELSAITETRAPHRIRELEREKQAVLKAIKEIELDYQMRKISEPDYLEMVERYRARALRLMGDLALGDDYRALIERELKGRLAARAAAGTGASNDVAGSSNVGDGASNVGAGTRTDVPGTSNVVDGASNVGGGTPSSASAAPMACPACASANDPDAQFCKKCGRALPPAALPV